MNSVVTGLLPRFSFASALGLSLPRPLRRPVLLPVGLLRQRLNRDSRQGAVSLITKPKLASPTLLQGLLRKDLPFAGAAQQNGNEHI